MFVQNCQTQPPSKSLLVGQHSAVGNLGFKVKTAHRVPGETVRCETVIETGSRRIEGLILNSEQRVGRRLPSEPKLSAMSRVSRSSLREALKGLVFIGRIGPVQEVEPISSPREDAAMYLIENFESNFRLHERIFQLVARLNASGALKAVFGRSGLCGSSLAAGPGDSGHLRTKLQKPALAFLQGKTGKKTIEKSERSPFCYAQKRRLDVDQGFEIYKKS
jgi:hypothetical protein